MANFAPTFLGTGLSAPLLQYPQSFYSTPPFLADGTKLVTSDYSYTNPNGPFNIYVKDFSSGSVEIVSADSQGNAGNGGSYFIAASSDCSKIVFYSTATNLTLPGKGGLFLKDLITGYVTQLPSYIGGNPQEVYVSNDGNRILFSSDSGNVGPYNEDNDIQFLYQYDLKSQSVARINVDKNGNSLGGDHVRFENDSSKIIFHSWAGFVEEDSDTREAKLFFDVNGAGAQRYIITDDNKKVFFTSEKSNLIAGDANGVADIFVKDIATGITTLVSSTSSGRQFDGNSSLISVNSDGSKALIFANDSSLNNQNGGYFIKDLATGSLTNVSEDYSGRSHGLYGSAMSGDFSRIAFFSSAATPDYNGGLLDLFVKDLESGKTIRIPVGIVDDLDSMVIVRMSADGAKVALGGRVWDLAHAFDVNVSGYVEQHYRDSEHGTLLFDDKDQNQHHTVTVSAPDGALGVLNAAVSKDTDSDGTGEISWNYTVSDSALQVLHGGETRTENFTIHLNDGETSVDQIVAIYLVGIDQTLVGGIYSDSLKGSIGYDLLSGGPGGDTLDGGRGIDTLYGGGGNDTYYVDSSNDVVSEESTGVGINDGGHDLVYSSASYKLGSFVEDLTLTGAADLTGTGNTKYNIITGNDGNNTLWGMAGNDTLNGGNGQDTLYGGSGDDTYYINSASDQASEQSSGVGVNDGGHDLVYSSIGYTLGTFIEDLTLTGTANINGAGNENYSNIIIGNSGANYLSGLSGGDTLSGYDGNDTLDGGVGGDSLSGGSGNDLLLGGSGYDTLIGGVGNDTLNGGVGPDTFVFSAAGAANGVDVIQDFVHGSDDLLFTTADYGFAAGHSLGANEFTVGTMAVGISAQFVWNATTHILFWDHDGEGGDAAIAIAAFNIASTLSAVDIHIG